MDWKNKRVLITGVAGFTGRHLVSRLRCEAGLWIAGSDVSDCSSVSLDACYCTDLTEADAAERLVAEAAPDVVFHLAGLFGSAAEEPLWRVNVGGLQHLCDALRRHARAAAPVRLLAVGSAAELGSRGAARLPVDENAPCVPESAYGRSKLEATRLALAEPADSPLSIVIARPFNLVGPGLGRQLALGNFARQIAAILRGEREAVHCGPLDNRRDYVDVRDVVEAYALLAVRGRAAQVYNVCAGRSYLLRELLDLLIAHAQRAIPVICDSPRGRPGDLPDIYGSFAKLDREVGWRPQIPIERSMADLLAAEIALRA